MASDAGRPDPDRGRERFQGDLRDALRLEAQRSGVRPGPALLRAALQEPAPRRGFRRGPTAAAAAAVVVLLLVGWLYSLPARNSGSLGGEASHTPGTSATASLSAPTSPAPVTLADCQIYPEDASLAFSGWATTDVLQVTGGSADPGQPVYALVTRGLAEWMGWRSPDAGPIFPPPVGRMGCIYDPSTGEVSQVGVPMDWQPPNAIDGCPASPADEYAGYAEIGGPRAWALLPTGASGWAAGQQAVILYRLSPPLAPGKTLTAWAVPLEGGDRVDGAVGSASAGLPSAEQATPGPGEFSYYVVEQPLTGSGCWVLNVAVDGQLAGSAITSVAAQP